MTTSFCQRKVERKREKERRLVEIVDDLVVVRGERKAAEL
jgi:hypothetical protein